VVALPDGVAEVTPLVMSESQLTLTQIQAGKDAQLKQAITNLAA
jgi:hypothetical protein